MPEEAKVEEQVKEPEQEQETHDGFIALDKHQKDINVQHKKYRDEERGRVSAEERATKVEKELETLKSQQAEVVVPPVPDQYSETYTEDVAERDAAIKRQAENEAEQTRQAEQQKQRDEVRVTDETAALQKRVAAFDSNMVTHGLNPIETKTAADVVIGYGISDTFQDILLEDPDGPLFVNYLSQNPVELEEMNRMTTLQLVNHLNGDIRAKASLLKPKTSNAPDPPINLKGGGAPEQKEDWERGAVYE